MYRRRYESRCSSKPKLQWKQKKIKYGVNRFSIWRMEFLHPAMWHDHDIDFVRWLHPAMWHVALELWQWIHQVAAPCNVICGSGATCHWIRPNVRHIGILHLISISTHHGSRHVILYQSAKFYPNQTTLGRKNDVMSIFKMAYLSHLQDSWDIFDRRDPIMGSLKSPVKLT